MSSSPLLNCMSTLYKVSMQEMACCKDMMSDACDMGQDHEPCCQSNSNSSVAAAIHPTQVVHLDIGTAVFASLVMTAAPDLSSRRRLTQADDGLAPPAPPGDISILRI